MNRPVIFHLITGLAVGGTEMALTRLLPATAQHFSHHVCSILPAGPIAHELTAQGIPVHSLNLRHAIDITAFLKLKQLLVTISPSILATYLIHADLLGRFAGTLAHVPVIISNQRGSLLQWRWLKLFEYVTSGLVDTYVVQTHIAKQRLRKCYWTKQIEVLPNGVALPRERLTINEAKAQLGLDQSTRYVTCVSQLRRGKGHLVLLKAWRAISPHFPQTHLLFVGEGEMRQPIEHYCLKNQLPVTLLGQRRDVSTVLQASDIFVLPTEAEGMSNALLEAMAHQLPCITSDIKANAEVITDTVNGLLFRKNDPVSLAAALRTLLTDSQRARQLGVHARATIEEHFALDTVAAQYTSLIKSFLQ